MTFYASWFKQTVSNGNGPSTNAIALQADLTPAQVTVTTTGNRLIYNMEYKPSPVKENKPKPRSSAYRSRESTASSTTSNTSNTFAAANIVAARFQNHSRSHTGGHSRQDSTESQAIFINEDSMWEDWIVKYVSEEKQTAVDDALMEDWIFETL